MNPAALTGCHNKKDCMTIYAETRYTDDDGRIVVHKIPLDGNPVGYKPFSGEDILLIIDHVNKREHDMPARFPIPVGEYSFKKPLVDQVKEAFANYDAAKIKLQRETQEEVSLKIAEEIKKQEAAEIRKEEKALKPTSASASAEEQALSPEVVAALSAMVDG